MNVSYHICIDDWKSPVMQHGKHALVAKVTICHHSQAPDGCCSASHASQDMRLQRAAVCCSALQCGAVCLMRLEVYSMSHCRVLQGAARYCRVLQRGAVLCKVVNKRFKRFTWCPTCSQRSGNRQVWMKTHHIE